MILLNFFLSIQIVITIFIFLVDNLIYSVVLLVSIFLNASVLLFMLKMDFLAFIFIIIYAGAIAILFLFVIMMINIKNLPINSIFKKYIIFFSIVFIFLNQFFYFVYNQNVETIFFDLNLYTFFDLNHNLINFSQLLYSFNNFSFLIAGLILLIAMIGTIMLTLNFNLIEINQIIEKQNSTIRYTTSTFNNNTVFLNDDILKNK